MSHTDWREDEGAVREALSLRAVISRTGRWEVNTGLKVIFRSRGFNLWPVKLMFGHEFTLLLPFQERAFCVS